MTEAFFSINNAGKLISVRYYTITAETLARKIITDELIKEILHRSSDQEDKAWNFTFEDLQVEILKKHEYKIDFFVSRDVLIGGGGRQQPLYH